MGDNDTHIALVRRLDLVLARRTGLAASDADTTGRVVGENVCVGRCRVMKRGNLEAIRVPDRRATR